MLLYLLIYIYIYIILILISQPATKAVVCGVTTRKAKSQCAYLAARTTPKAFRHLH